jgi:hypothetical protein
LQAEKKSLTEKIDALHQFLDNRVLWTSNVRDIASRLPAAIQLTALQGSSELEAAGRTPTKKSLRLAATVELLPRGALPPEVYKLVGALRDDPLLKRVFAQVELGSISQSRAERDRNPMASFTILCQSGK